jgi:hypothetical protein
MLRRLGNKTKFDIRVAMPGIIVSFDENTQLAQVQPAIRENLKDSSGTVTPTQLPILPDVLIVSFRGGGFVLTTPVNTGDEVLIIFSDTCVDAWWANGGVQNQISNRRHDLSDSFAILGPWSQPRALLNYSMDAMELRTEDGSTKISIKPGTIDITCQTANINAESVNLAGGGGAVARVGDSIAATGTDPQGGTVTVTGTITSGSSKVQAG